MGRVRSSVPRTRLPLHQRALADPAALRRWLLVAVLASTTTVITARVLAGAEAARQQWGQTRSVLVVERRVAAGQALAAAVGETRWPLALIPDGALAHLPAGAEAVGPLGPGTLITETLVAQPGSAGRTGRRRVALPTGAARLPLDQGDRVDVWATVDPSLAGGRLTTRRVAVDAVVTSAGSRSVVVAVTAHEAAEVAEAAALATVTIVASS